MNFEVYISKSIFILFIILFTVGVRVDIQFVNAYSEEYLDDFNSTLDEELLNNLSVEISNSSYPSVSLSSILTVLSTQYASLTGKNNNKSLDSSKNQSASFQVLIKDRINQNFSLIVPSYELISDLVDQFNHYRNIDIISRIKQCDSNMKLSDMCENYSFDNHTYSLVRESNVKFQSLYDIYDSLIERTIVEKLNTNCPVCQWCLGNLTKYNIRFTFDVFRQLGYSFCLLETCYDRLHTYVITCSSKIPENISIPTLKLLPMLCTLYKEQPMWSSTECADQIVYLLHILYAFWPQVETCYQTISSGIDICTYECLTFNNFLHELENKCNSNASFLTRIPALAWYRLANLEKVCHRETTAVKHPFMSSVKNFISSNIVWYRFHERPVYAALFLIVVISIAISFSLCLYFMSSTDYDSITRNFDDGYEYTRLHDSTIELGENTENSSIDFTSNDPLNQSQSDLNANRHSFDH